MGLVMCAAGNDGVAFRRLIRDQLREAAKASDSHTGFESLAAAYEVDAMMGRTASKSLGETAGRVWRDVSRGVRHVEVVEAKLRTLVPMGEAAAEGDTEACRALWEVCQAEDLYSVRFRASQMLAAGGQPAYAVLESEIQQAPDTAQRLLSYGETSIPRPEWTDVRRCSVLGWVMPLLAASCERACGSHVQRALDSWIGLAESSTPDRPGLQLGIEACLAQGFKWEANREPGAAEPGSRDLLIDSAKRLLRGSRWWYTQIAVLQALALWALGAKDDPDRREDLRREIEAFRKSGRHPFVQRAAINCWSTISAQFGIAGREPLRAKGATRWIWIDEVGVASKIGARRLSPEPDPVTRLWIPPAAGWQALIPRTRQLVADVLVLLNLVEGGDRADDTTKLVRIREARRWQVYERGSMLPECIRDTRGRGSLAVGAPKIAPRAGCMDSCGFALCPYPAKAGRPFRGELSETFCREQQRLLRGPDRRLPSWQDDARLGFLRKSSAFKELREFWKQMERRDHS
jgi:hypothetical protein